MYTTNAIEAPNAQLRKVNKKRGAFPNPEAVRKVLYLTSCVFPDRVPA